MEKMKKINLEDIVQICLGSTILAIPVAFTEEAWTMSKTLPQLNIILIFFTSIFMNGCFIYYGVYEGIIKGKTIRFFSRIAINYIITLLTVSYILFLLGILPTHSDFNIWLHRVILISFPASLSGAVVDSFDKE
jgi:uncharacterized membrane protein